MTTPPMVAFVGQQSQAARDVNTASLCRIGQETVQDIVLRTMEIFQLLRNMQVSVSCDFLYWGGVHAEPSSWFAFDCGWCWSVNHLYYTQSIQPYLTPDRQHYIN